MADWKELETRLEAVAGDSWLSKRLLNQIDQAKNVYIACSGGADSVFLTLLFARKFPGGRVSVLHFNHKLRGADSDQDERFVENLCKGLDLPLITGAWEHRDASESVSEETARDARMGFFAKAVGDFKAGSIILTGHHADDIAETMLMRLSRGSGLQGLTAPRELSEGSGGLRFARPLLGLRKRRILDWLKQAGASWREDKSNLTGQFYRNRLRKNVIPEWEIASERPVAQGAALSRELLEEDWIALEGAFENAWASIEKEDGILDWSPLSSAPRAFQRRALTRFVSAKSNAVLSSSAMETVLESLGQKESFKLSIDGGRWIQGEAGEGVRIVAESEAIHWTPQNLPLNVRIYLPQGGVLSARAVSMDGELLRNVRSGAFSHDNTVYLAIDEKQKSPLRVRQWQPGDSYQPIGRESAVKLKELFIDRKIPREERRIIPIVTGSIGEILWVPGLPPNRDYLLTETTTRALQLTYEN